jgi:hypothetical protein
MYCCVECFSDKIIREFIKECGEIGECEYCDSKKVFTTGVDIVGDFVMRGVNRAYEDPAERVGYESAEGGYLLPTTDIYDILIYVLEIFSEKVDDPYDLIGDMIPDTITEYVQKDPYGPPRGDSDEIYHWERFCKLVKNDKRYTAFMPVKTEHYPWTPHPSALMQTIINDLAEGHLNIIEKGTKIFRARIKKEGATYKHKDLTSPPPRTARNNRMSPAGISYFYGALNPETCISELRPTVGEQVIVAKFIAAKNLLVLDLTETTEEEISVFQEDYSYQYERILVFIEHFVSEISKPIRPMDQEIDYVPTQIFTEYLRQWDYEDIYGEEEHKKEGAYIVGLMFKSSLEEGGKNVVLFRGPEISVKTAKTDKPPLLNYRGSQTHNVTRVRIEAEPIKHENV